MKKTMTKFMLFSMLFAGASVQAADNLTFKGNLIIPNCTINNNAPLETNFGDVEIQTLGSNPNMYSHEKLLSIPVRCPYNLGTPKMKISGKLHTPAKGAAGIQTSKYNEGLVIYLRTKAKDSWISYGREFNIPNDSITGGGVDKTLTMYAALGYYKTMKDLKPGPFTAGTTLEIRYE
ncbi:fimbrial protein [Escherichia coli]|nr:fimbrial protein [Escherichia coli]EFJ0493308.1 fimbrial protein [Escherichia coli]EFJ2843744.1 fimbrial protein [Escherichia coli]EFJ2912033.1 fimbrial protein [Escherichia coli]EFU2655988.1 fimbrial protein [Escherichia coli]